MAGAVKIFRRSRELLDMGSGWRTPTDGESYAKQWNAATGKFDPRVLGSAAFVAASTAYIADSADKRYVTDAQRTVIGNTSGINTGDQDLSPFAPIVSPSFTGTPMAPTPLNAVNNTQIATTGFVHNLVTDLINLAPSSLDTLGEIATQLANDESAVGALTIAVGGKLAKASNLSDLTDTATALQNLGAFGASHVAKSASFTVAASDRGKIFEITTGSTNRVVTMPSAATAGNGFVVILRKADSGTGLITNSATSGALGIQGHEYELRSDGTSWYQRLLGGTTDASGNYTLSSAGKITLTPSGSAGIVIAHPDTSTGQELQFVQSLSGYGNTALLSKNIGASTGVISVGYNPAGLSTVYADTSCSWVIEGDYDDGSGQRKTEAYLEFVGSDRSTIVRPIFFQLNKVTNALGSSILKGNPVNLTDTAGSASAQFYPQNVIFPGSASADTLFTIQAGAGHNSTIRIGANGTDDLLRISRSSTGAFIFTTDAVSLSLGANNATRWTINSSGTLAATSAYNLTTTGVITGVGSGLTSLNADNISSGTLGVTRGGNGLATATLGDLRYGSGTNAIAALVGNTTSTINFLSQTGTGTVSAAPAWRTPSQLLSDISAVPTSRTVAGKALTGNITLASTDLTDTASIALKSPYFSTFGTEPGAAWQAASVANSGANTAIAVRIVPRRNMLITKLRWSTGATVSGNYDIAIYDDASSAARLWSLGVTAFPSASTVTDVTVSPALSLTAGTTYNVVFASDTSTAQFKGVAVGNAGTGIGLDGNLIARRITSATSFPTTGLPNPLTLGSSAETRVPLVELREA